jgi:hypothetical protein
VKPRFAAVALAVLCAAATAEAGDHARAVQLFQQGQALAAKGRCAEAIPKLIETLAIEPSVGALLNLGACHEKTSAPDLAWKRFREAERLARERGDDRADFARTHAEALEPLLPKLVVEVPASARGAGLAVRVDDDALDPSQWGLARAVVSGQHVVSASMPNREPWQSVVVTTGQATRVVTVPELSPVAVERPPPRARDGATQRTIGLVVAGSGALGLALGGVFGGVALARTGDARALQTGPAPAPFDAAKADAQTWGTASTVAFVAGGVLLAGGLVVWLTAPAKVRAAMIAPPMLAFRF